MMNRSLYSTLCLGALLATLSAPAWAASLGDVISALETPFQTKTDEKLRIYDYSADFFQESKIASLDRLQRASGEVEVAFDYQRTDTVPRVKFRWQYDQPTNQEIVSDGRTMWVYLPGNRQVIESDVSQIDRQQGENPVTFLSGLGNLSRDFHIRWASPNTDREGNYILELQPRRISQLIHTLQIVVDRDAVRDYAENDRTGDIFPILATTVKDPNENLTTIEFQDIRVNRNISERFFHFNRPAGVEVVRPSGEQMGF